MKNHKIERLRSLLKQNEFGGIVLSNSDNVFYTSGYNNVMDGWQLPEPISAVFVPADSTKPVILCIPEASLIGIIVSEREGHPIYFDKIATFDLLNFCKTARAQDAYMQLGEDVSLRLQEISKHIIGDCKKNLILSLEQIIGSYGSPKPILFDDMRIAYRLSQKIDFNFEDGFELVIEARSVKTPEEITLFCESGIKADSVMSHTVNQLGVGAKWCDVEKSVAHFMIDEGIDPLPTSPMLFGGSYDLVFRPDLFRTHYDSPFEEGQIAILETQGKYKNIWLDINRTAHIGKPPKEYLEQHEIVKRCFLDVVSRLKPGKNSSEICAQAREEISYSLDSPDKLLMIVHSIGHVPLESPKAFPSTGLDSALEGFEIKKNMILSFDCLYFGSKLGPSHMENVFVINENNSYSIYQYPIDLIEVH
ncbi:MAG: hypothetical protein CML73_05790 [Rhodobiaceae bacterium]|nr:hypothetical protein [Rhodobiaceae bacterium]